jgi:hypothetical protein
MEYSRGLILTFDLLRPPNRAQARLEQHSDPPWCDTWLTVHDRVGGWRGSSHGRLCTSGLPGLFDEPLRAAHSFRRRLGARYLERLYILDLPAGDILRLRAGGHRESLTRLVDWFLDPASEHRVWPTGIHRGSVLFLVPRSWPAEEAEWPTRVTEVREDLGLTKMAPIPEILGDLLVLSAITPSLGEDALTTVWLEPGGLGDEDLCLPQTLLDLVEYMVSLHLVRHLAAALKALPLAATDPAKSLARLGQRSGMLHGYLEQHFLDRSRTWRELLDSVQDHTKVTEALRSNSVARSGSGPPPRSFPEIVGHPMKQPLLRLVHWEWREAVREFEAVHDNVEEWSTVATDYLRDLVGAEVASSNLSLQHTIRRLTVLALAISGLALVVSAVGMLPDELKNALWKLLLSTVGRMSR